MSTTLQPRPTASRNTEPPAPKRSTSRRVAAAAAAGLLALLLAIGTLTGDSSPEPELTAAEKARTTDEGVATADAAGPEAAPGVTGAVTPPSRKEMLAELPPHLRKRMSQARGPRDLAEGARRQPVAQQKAAKPDTASFARRHVPTPAERRAMKNPRQRQESTTAPKGPTKAQRAAPASPQEQGPNRLTVSDQATDGSRIRVTRVVTNLASGFVTVHRMHSDGPGALLGVAPIRAGRANDVVVRLDTPLTRSGDVLVAIHEDSFRPGVYEEGPDRLMYGSAGPVARVIRATTR